jgi:molybdopterin-guanine dinucleotide biosynthesis protein A
MGTDKARLHVHGVPLLVHVAEALREKVASVSVIARVQDQYQDLGFATLPDLEPDHGPMGGLYTALGALAAAHAPSTFCLVAACDLYGIQPHWIDALCEGAATHPDAQAVAFCARPADAPSASGGEGGRNPRGWEPLLALYSPALLPDIRARLHTAAAQPASQRALWRLLDACALPLPLPHDWDRLVVVNTPGDLSRAAPTPRPCGSGPSR